MHPYIHCSIIYNSQDVEAAQVSLSSGPSAITIMKLCRKKKLKKKQTWSIQGAPGAAEQGGDSTEQSAPEPGLLLHRGGGGA